MAEDEGKAGAREGMGRDGHAAAVAGELLDVRPTEPAPQRRDDRLMRPRVGWVVDLVDPDISWAV